MKPPAGGKSVGWIARKNGEGEVKPVPANDIRIAAPAMRPQRPAISVYKKTLYKT
jgi:hypothetical protein